MEQPDDLPAAPDDLLVPDDASALELDRLALQRERAHEARRRRVRRLVLTRRHDRYGLSGPVVAGVLLLVALTAGASVVLLAPSGGLGAVAAAPLADAPVGPTAGDLLPAVQVVPPAGLPGSAAPVDVRSYRPSAVVLVPQPCSCRADVEQLIRAAHSRGLRVHAVLATQPSDLAAEVALAAEPPTGGGTASLAVDTSGALFATYPQKTGRLTVLVVGPDGVLLDVQSGWTLDVGLPSLDRAAGLR